MKIRFYLALAAAALVMTNCSKEEEPVQEKQQSKGFTATIEGASRSAVTDAGVFSWTAGDKISVWNGSSFDTYANSDSDVNTFNPEGDADIAEAKDYAVYPASVEHNFEDGTLLVNLPASYAHGSTNAPMLATIEEGSSTLAFKHLGGLMRFVVKNVPAGASSFVFTATNNVINGGFGVNNGQISQPPAVVPVGDGNNTVAITFTELTAEAASMTFYVPLPVGTYGDYTVAIKGTNVDLSDESTNVSNTIARRTLLLMPTFTVENGQLNKGNAIAGVIDLEDGNKDATITDDAEVVVTPGADADATATLNYTPAQDGTSVLSISDGSGATESGESEGKVVVSTASGSTVASCEINTPSLTVELSAAENGSATFSEVTALTAEQTLVIGEGVTIKTLKIKGGNVVLKGNVENIESEEATTITLESDIALVNAMTFSKGDVTVDLNGYTIENKSANNTTQLGNAADECIVFYVDGADANLTLNATNGGKVIATGDGSTSYYNTAVWVTNGATTTINGGEYSNTADPEGDGCDLIYGRDGGKIYVKGGTFKAGAIRSNLGGGIYGVLNCKDSMGSVITVSGGKFYEYGATEAAKVGNGEVILLEGGYYWSAKDAEGYYTVTDKIETEEALKSAIANTDNVKLGANVTLTDAITINKTITVDLNGYTIENKSANNTTQLGNVADECIVFYVDGAEANLTLNATNGGKVIATGDGSTSYYNTAVWVTNGATTTINGGEYSNTADPEGDGCDLIYGRDGGKIYVKGGIFKAGAIRSNLGGGIYGVLNCKDSMGSVITVSGGKFYEYGATEAAKVGNGEVILLGDGYKWTEKDSDNYYSVVADN